MKKELLQLLEQMNLSDIIEFIGISRDVSGIMSASDLFVLSSSFEGFGLVVAEAMSCEIPVVATDCGGVKEVVGNCGILVPPKNSKLLSEAINKAINLTIDERAILGKIARQRVIDNFSLDSISNKYMELYKGNYK